MHIIHQDNKKAHVKFKVTNPDDLWYLSTLIEPPDLLSASTTRKLKLGTDENAKVIKKTIYVTIEVETVEFSQTGSALRINGKIKSIHDDIPKDSYQSISLEINDEATLQKKAFLSYHLQKLQEASEKKYSYLICLFDREEALFALTKTRGHEILLNLKGDVPKKAQKVEIKKDFYEELLSLLQSYAQRYNPERIILASTAFYKEDLMKKITSSQLKQKITLATCSDVSETALSEIMRSTELTYALKTSRAREEQLLIEELLHEINKDGKAVYGFEQTKHAINIGAAQTLLLTEKCIQQFRLTNRHPELDQLLKTMESTQSKIHLISSEHDAGKKLDGLGGIAALLRYKLSY